MNVLCLCDTMALSPHINIATAEGEIKRSFFFLSSWNHIFKALVGACERAEE